jgi:hypothetical protein
MDFVTSALILSWVAIALLGLVVARLVRQVHELQQGGAIRQPRRIGLPIGETAPGLDALDPKPGQAMLLLFLSIGCRTCREVLAEAVDQVQAGLEIRVLYAGAAPAGSIEVGGVSITAYSGQAALFERYDAVATPFAVLVDADGRVVRSEPLGSRDAARRLLASLATAERSAR